MRHKRSAVVRVEGPDGDLALIRRGFGVNCFGALAVVEAIAARNYRLVAVEIRDGSMESTDSLTFARHLWRQGDDP